MSKKKSKTIDVLLATISDGTHAARCNTLRSLCPCRSNNREAEVWEEIFTRALEGGMRERNHAIHAIGAILALAWAWFRLRAGRLTSTEFVTVQIFWYFVVLVWPFLYLQVYL